MNTHNNQGAIARNELSEFLCAAIALACRRNRSDVTPNVPLMELMIDSLTFISVLAQVEAVCGVKLNQEEILDLLTTENVADLVRRILPEG